MKKEDTFKIKDEYLETFRDILKSNLIEMEDEISEKIVKDFLQTPNIFIKEEDFQIFVMRISLESEKEREDIIKYFKSEKKNIKQQKLCIYFVKSVREKLFLEKVISDGKYENSYISFVTTGNLKEYSISIESRLKSIRKVYEEVQDEAKIKIIGDVYTASIYDLVQLYDGIGDELFEKNVRFGIKKDVNEVKKEIQKTLKKNPSEFWFLNNGITMLVKEETVDRSKNNKIVLNYKLKNNISIINGAQTMTSCAEFFYSNEKEEIIEKAKKNAFVILRVIYITTDEQEVIKGIENNISVSLNRQRPIGAEDLAFMTSFVWKINAEYSIKEGGKYFKIVRQGEEAKGNKYELTKLSKMIYASRLLSPGKAKNMYADDALKIEGDKFSNEDLLNVEMLKSDITYNNYFGWINLAFELFDKYENAKIDFEEITIENKEAIKYLFKNGNYYFISTMMFLTKKTNEKMFLNVPNCLELCMNQKNVYEDIQKIIKIFLCMYDRLLQTKTEKERSIKYTDLKSDTLFKEFMKYYNEKIDVENQDAQEVTAIIKGFYKETNQLEAMEQ